MIAPALLNLINVLEDAKKLLQLPDNNFAWSSWEDADEATAEIDRHIKTLSENRLPNRVRLSVLFVVAGPIQEVSVSSGWAYPFLELSKRFDRAMEKVYE